MIAFDIDVHFRDPSNGCLTNQNVSVFKIISPIRSDIPLSSDVPDVQFEAVALNGFYVKSLSGRDVSDILRSQSFQQSCFTRVVQSQ